MSKATTAGEAVQALAELRELLASDSLAITFLTMAAYRAAMLRTADEYLSRLRPPAPAGT